jgi:hypothetical protein
MLEDAWRVDLSRDEIIRLALEAEGALLDDRGLALGAVVGLCTLGWLLGHCAVVHPDPAERAWGQDELAFWLPFVRKGIEAL